MPCVIVKLSCMEAVPEDAGPLIRRTKELPHHNPKVELILDLYPQTELTFESHRPEVMDALAALFERCAERAAQAAQWMRDHPKQPFEDV